MTETETELKLQIDARQLAGVRAALRRRACTRTHLQARYFDTPDGALAAAGYVLRLRREGRRWVQTLKGAGEGPLQRLEHEVVLRPRRAERPALDAERHRGAAGSAAFFAALGDATEGLAPVHEVDVQRTACRLRHRGATIELALDEGRIVAGGRHERVREIEFELVAGPLAPLGALAAAWAERHGLWLDVRPKSQRGAMLAQGLALDPLAPVRNEAPLLAPATPPDAALRRCIGAVLQPLLTNAAALAAGRGGAEHVHQTRVGLRRLLSLLREFGEMSDAVDPAWAGVLAVALRALGATRDDEVLAATLLPLLRAAGAPEPSQPFGAARAPAQDASATLRSAPLTRVWIELLVFAQGTAPAAAPGLTPPALLELARPRLARLHKRLRRAGKRFDQIDDAARHRARKQLKRLRYCAEALAALWPARAWRRHLERLRAAQDALGRFQDLTLAETAISGQREHDGFAWFALGWLAAQRAHVIADAGQALRALSARPRFLR